jgi:hypothetical protein
MPLKEDRYIVQSVESDVLLTVFLMLLTVLLKHLRFMVFYCDNVKNFVFIENNNYVLYKGNPN